MKNKTKLEFFISTSDHTKFVNLCKINGYTISEILRRAVEKQIIELEEKEKNK